MSWQPPSPLEQYQMNPHGFDYESRVITPDGQLGTVIKAGFSHCTVTTDDGHTWKGKFIDLRPHVEGEEPRPTIDQLSLI